MSSDVQLGDKTILKLQDNDGYKSQEINSYIQVEEEAMTKKEGFWDNWRGYQGVSLMIISKVLYLVFIL